MSAIKVIGDADTVLAFALGGVPGSVVSSAAELRQALAAATDATRPRGACLLLITRGVAALAPADVRDMTLDPAAPLVLIIAGYGESGGAVADDFVERTLGVRW